MVCLIYVENLCTLYFTRYRCQINMISNSWRISQATITKRKCYRNAYPPRFLDRVQYHCSFKNVCPITCVCWNVALFHQMVIEFRRHLSFKGYVMEMFTHLISLSVLSTTAHLVIYLISYVWVGKNRVWRDNSCLICLLVRTSGKRPPNYLCIRYV